jgi:hypothetical protein
VSGFRTAFGTTTKIEGEFSTFAVNVAYSSISRAKYIALNGTAMHSMVSMLPCNLALLAIAAIFYAWRDVYLPRVRAR